MVGPALRNRDMTDMNDDTSTRPSRRSETAGGPTAATELHRGERRAPLPDRRVWNSFRRHRGDSTPPARPGEAAGSHSAGIVRCRCHGRQRHGTGVAAEPGIRCGLLATAMYRRPGVGADELAAGVAGPGERGRGGQR